MELVSKFERIINWFFENGKWEDKFRKLNEDISEDKIDEIETLIDLVLPEDFKNLYSRYNGEINEKGIGNLRGHSFMSLNEIIEELRLYIEHADTEEGISSFPKKSIKEKYYHTKWIPIFSDYGGNFIGMDLDPGEEGKVGQMIIFGRDEDPNFVIADSLSDFFDLNLALMEKGREELKVGTHLHDIYRKLKVK